MEEPTDAGCRTPERDVNMAWNFKENDEPFPYYTQMYGSPSAYIAYSEEVELQRSKQTKRVPAYFDDVPSFDLKFTQETESIRTSVGLSNADDSIGETQKLLEYLTTYDSQTEPNLDVFHTPEHEKLVPARSGVSGNGSGIGLKCGMMGSSAITTYKICEATPLQTIVPKFVNDRTRRNTKPGKVMCSPYIRRAVYLKASTTIHEQLAADCLFSGRFAETDILFRTDFVNGPRGVLESLCPGIRIASGVVDIFTKILNHAEKFRDPLKPMQKTYSQRF
ncbi:hypothetical protein Tco_1121751 [Tanacetum coccineum]|uniref:Uncharacterized protein n=1 Tax=Tanacetum coccineum TaxID=301880 RepID=A0ABQ5IYL1_9ASTR